jgi:predicted DNA-binding transcriptional regulator AlpA
MSKLLYNVNELSAILGFTVSAIHAHLARKNFDAVPPPIRLGRRLAWSTEAVDLWLAEKVHCASASRPPHDDPRKRPVGRPRKRCG